jgi:hypothetical protein
MLVIVLLILGILFIVFYRNSKPALRDFSFLSIGMSYDQIVSNVGVPDRDVGSGVYLFQYDLNDGRKIMLQFFTKDHLSRIWLIQTDGQQELWIPDEKN